MQKMIKFKLSRECREIAVNPARILYVSHYETGASSLHFGKECFIRVQGEIDDIVCKIEAALTDAPSDPHPPRPDQDRAGAGVN